MANCVRFPKKDASACVVCKKTNSSETPEDHCRQMVYFDNITYSEGLYNRDYSKGICESCLWKAILAAVKLAAKGNP